MLCNKCQMNKPDTEFQTYFHSTQQAWRTRKQCNECFNNAKKLYKIKLKTKQCIECGELKSITEFHNYKSLSPGDKKRKICKVCTNAKDKSKRKSRYHKREDNGEPVLPKPNTYRNQEQKDLAFEVMQALGFTFNPDNGKWFKEGFKTPDGKFVQIEENKRLKKEKQLKKVEELPVWEKIRVLRKDGMSIQNIKNNLGISYNAVYQFLKEDGKKERS